MGKFKQKRQTVEHGGSFIMVPRRVLASVAWRHAGYRARSVLIAFCNAFTGRNNGELAFSIKAIGKAIGSANHGLTARAVAELIELGFLECTSDANRAMAKARTYRITFITTIRSTQAGEQIVPATHDYEAWRPTKKRKFGGGESTITDSEKSTDPPTKVKIRVGGPTPCVAQKPPISVSGVVGDLTPLLDYHSPEPEGESTLVRQPPEPGSADSLLTDPETLRRWARQAVKAAGYGGNNRLAADAGISAVQLSRFRNGRPLPVKHHASLQAACARILPFNKLSS